MKDLGDAGARSWPPCESARLNVVFVHGFQGDHLATWTYKTKAKGLRFWEKLKLVQLFDLLAKDFDIKCDLPDKRLNLGSRHLLNRV